MRLSRFGLKFGAVVLFIQTAGCATFGSKKPVEHAPQAASKPAGLLFSAPAEQPHDATENGNESLTMRDRDDEAVNEDESELPAAPRRGLLFGNGDSSRLSWPLTNGRFTSGFGMRGKRHFHKGIDVVAPRGSAIYAAAPGRVTYAGRRRGYGLVVTVEHDMVKTVYAHMSKIFAKKGQVVDRRTVIGAVGSTGRASGAHVHFEVRDLETDKPMDPMLFLPPQNLLSQVSHLSNKAG